METARRILRGDPVATSLTSPSRTAASAAVGWRMRAVECTWDAPCSVPACSRWAGKPLDEVVKRLGHDPLGARGRRAGYPAEYGCCCSASGLVVYLVDERRRVVVLLDIVRAGP
jgi:hypothetical protein